MLKVGDRVRTKMPPRLGTVVGIWPDSNDVSVQFDGEDRGEILQASELILVNPEDRQKTRIKPAK